MDEPHSDGKARHYHALRHRTAAEMESHGAALNLRARRTLLRESPAHRVFPAAIKEGNYSRKHRQQDEQHPRHRLQQVAGCGAPGEGVELRAHARGGTLDARVTDVNIARARKVG